MNDRIAHFEINRVYARLVGAVPKAARAAFLYALVSGLFVHLYMFLGKYPNHDEVLCLFAHGDLAESGRWLLILFGQLCTNFSMPWVNGLMTLLMMAGAVSVLTCLFDITSPFVAALFAAAFVAFPSVGNTFAFMFTSDAYAYVFLILAVSLYLLDRTKWGFLYCIPLLVVVLASYQPYLAFAVAILGLRGLQILLCGTWPDAEVWKKVGKYAAFLLGGVALYIVSTKIVLSFMHVQLSDYNGLDTMGQIVVSELPKTVFDAYYAYFEFLFVQSGRYSGLGLSIAHLLTGIICILLFVLLLKRNAFRSKGQRAFAVFVFLLTPLLQNAGYLMGANSVHIMMMGQVVLLYLLGFIELNALLSLDEGTQPDANAPRPRRAAGARLLSGTAFLLSALVLYCTVCWSIYTNQNYLALQLKYENIYALTNRVVNRVEQDERYFPGRKVAFIGDVANGNYTYSKGPEFGDLDYAVGFGGAKEYEFIYNDLHVKRFCSYYLGVKFEELDTQTLERIQSSPEFLAMPAYPAAGSISLIGDILVVRMGGDRI